MIRTLSAMPELCATKQKMDLTLVVAGTSPLTADDDPVASQQAAGAVQAAIAASAGHQSPLGSFPRACSSHHELDGRRGIGGEEGRGTADGAGLTGG